MSTEINNNHLERVQTIDRILGRVFRNGENTATFEQVFSDQGDDDNEFSKLVAVYFPNPHTPQLKCLEYLSSEDLLTKEGQLYHLTFKGILRLNDNTFEDEYRNSVTQNSLVKIVQESTILKNYLSIAISLVALGISILAFMVQII